MAEMILMGITSWALILLIIGLPIMAIIFLAYKLIKKLSHDHVEYQYKYQQYKGAEAELNDIEADLRQHQDT